MRSGQGGPELRVMTPATNTASPDYVCQCGINVGWDPGCSSIYSRRNVMAMMKTGVIRTRLVPRPCSWPGNVAKRETMSTPHMA